MNLKHLLTYPVPALLLFLLSCNSAGLHEVKNAQDSVNDLIKKSAGKLDKFSANEVVTKQMIDAAKDEDLDELIFFNIYLNIATLKDFSAATYHKKFEKLSEGQRAFYFTRCLEKNIELGGFQEYFTYFVSNGQFIEDARAGYRVLGMNELSELAGRAAETYNKHEADSLTRFHQLDTIAKQLIQKYNPTAVRVRYIRAHTDEFAPSG